MDILTRNLYCKCDKNTSAGFLADAQAMANESIDLSVSLIQAWSLSVLLKELFLCFQHFGCHSLAIADQVPYVAQKRVFLNFFECY